MSTHCNMFRSTSGGENSCVACQDSISPGKKWQVFYGSFWRWRLYYIGSTTLTQPNEDLAPRHLLVSHCIMSGASVYVSLCLGVCIGQSPRQRTNFWLCSYLKICLVWQTLTPGWAVFFFFTSRYLCLILFSVDLVLFCLFKTRGLQWNLANVTYQPNVHICLSSAPKPLPYSVTQCQNSNQMRNVLLYLKLACDSKESLTKSLREETLLHISLVNSTSISHR